MPNGGLLPSIKDKSKVSPEAFIAATLDDIATGMRKVHGLLQEQRLEGINEAYDLDVTTSKQEIRPPAGKKWHAISVLNRGDADIYVGANVGWVNAVTIPKNGYQNLDMKRALIEYVNFRTSSGTASVTFNGIR